MRHKFYRHGTRSLAAYEKLDNSNFQEPLLLNVNASEQELCAAYVDKDHKLSDSDKLSQVSYLIDILI